MRPPTDVVCLEKGPEFHPLAGVGAGWFVTAFETTVGNTISEVLENFSDELRALLDANEFTTNALGTDECLRLVRQFQIRMAVAAEWAERVERLEDARREAAK